MNYTHNAKGEDYASTPRKNLKKKKETLLIMEENKRREKKNSKMT